MGPFSALLVRDYRLLWTGLAVSNVGTWMQTFGLGWLVVQLAQRAGTPHLAALYLGFVGLSRALPGILIGLFAGVAADRLDRRRLLMMSQSAGGIIAAILAAFTLSEQVTIVWILVLSALGQVAQSFDGPTRNALTGRLVTREALPSAVALNSTTTNLAIVLGPLLGGLLIVPIGVGGLMVVNAVSFIAVLAALFLMKPVAPAAPRDGLGVLAAVREGLAYIRNYPVLKWTISLVTVTSFFARPMQQLLPAFAQDALHVGAVELSWLIAATGVGAVAGSFCVALVGGRSDKGRFYAGAATVWGAFVLLLAFQREVAPSIACLVIAAWASQLYLGLSSTIHQTVPPDSFRGRTTATSIMMIQTWLPLGQMALGGLGSALGISVSLGIGGLIATAFALFVFLRVDSVRQVGVEFPLKRAASASHVA